MKIVKDNRRYIIFDDISNIKLCDLSVSIAKKYAKPIEFCDAFYVNENELNKKLNSKIIMMEFCIWHIYHIIKILRRTKDGSKQVDYEVLTSGVSVYSNQAGALDDVINSLVQISCLFCM